MALNWLPENIEIIDNEEHISQNIDKLKWQSEALIALWMIKFIDSQVTNHDIDLAYDKSNSRFYMISNNTNLLNIPLTLSEIEEYGEKLIVWLNAKKDLYIRWSFSQRSVYIDDSFRDWKNSSDTVVDRHVDSWISKLERQYEISIRNDLVEEFYVFLMNTLWVPIEEWDINREMCEWWVVTMECKLSLWNK